MIEAVLDLLQIRYEFLLSLVMEHIFISLLSFFIALILGLICGIFIYEYKRFSPFVLSSINILYTIPSISMLGLLIPLSGVGDLSAIIALVVYALLPMVKNTFVGLNGVGKNLSEDATSFGMTKIQLLFYIKLPLALPVILSGVRNMMVMTIALAGVASFIGAGGLGVMIYRGITMNNSAMVVLGSISVAILALFFDFLLSFCNRQNIYQKKNYILIPFGVLIALFIISSFFLFAKDFKKEVVVATKPMVEQYIIGEILKELIEAKSDIRVMLKHGIGGGSSNIIPAMQNKEIDMYPEYTGTMWNLILKQDSFYTEEKFDILQKELREKYQMLWLNKLGFDNTFGLAIRADLAKKHNIKTYSDLSKLAYLFSFGAEYDYFEREDGLRGLKGAYGGFAFKKTFDLDIGLKYKAINESKVDVINIFTTDPQLSSNLVVLQDDKRFYPSYQCGIVILESILEQHPELKDIIELLDNTISNDTMANLSARVAIDGINPNSVAKEFLKDRGLI